MAIRRATEGDIEALHRLEDRSWESGLRWDRGRISAFIKRTGTFTFVLESSNDGILGSIFTQRVHSLADLTLIRESVVESLADEEGSILQLIRVDAKAGLSHVAEVSVGSRLRDFCVGLASTTHLSCVCAITRCASFAPPTPTPNLTNEYLEYVARSQDPGLHFHLSAGSIILQCIPDYRPSDTSNLGFGVLVVYPSHVVSW